MSSAHYTTYSILLCNKSENHFLSKCFNMCTGFEEHLEWYSHGRRLHGPSNYIHQGFRWNTALPRAGTVDQEKKQSSFFSPVLLDWKTESRKFTTHTLEKVEKVEKAFGSSNCLSNISTKRNRPYFCTNNS